MKIMVESFKRIYESGKLNREQVKERVTTGKITIEEFMYITGEAYEHETA